MMAAAAELAVFAYGSLIDDPGGLGTHLVERRAADSPFNVEFARSALSRGGAPSLAPYESGGPVRGQLLLLDLTDSLPGRARVERLLRERERAPAEIEEILRWTELLGHPAAYVALPINLPGPTPARLAELALASVAALHRSGEVERNGIRYLRNAIDAGIETPLTPAYRDELLRRTGADSLEQAEREAIEAARA